MLRGIDLISLFGVSFAIFGGDAEGFPEISTPFELSGEFEKPGFYLDLPEGFFSPCAVPCKIHNGKNEVEISVISRPLIFGLKIPVNTATTTDLMDLPGIGPKLASRIVEFRNSSGPFASEEELDLVKGIGPKTLVRIRPYLSFN